MLGQPVSLTLPQVVGCKLVGSINPLTTSIDVVLGITKVMVLCRPVNEPAKLHLPLKCTHMMSVVCNVLYALIFQHLRQAGIAGKFVEFFGPGVSQLSAPDRTTIANMCPEYSATVSFFPVDQVTLQHFKKTSELHNRNSHFLHRVLFRLDLSEIDQRFCLNLPVF